MLQIEFYINDRLLDISDSKSLGIKLSRQIFKPAEFTSKDSQMSYKITLPNTPTNNEIFNFANIEEVKDKFNYEYNAKVYVDYILIFDGKFMLNEITESKYVGNLYIPAYKSVKDIFGDRVMNNPSSNSEKNKWIFKVSNASDITAWNKKVLSNFDSNIPSNCLFPYIMYGLIPKVSKNPDLWVNGEQVGEFTDKDLYDEYARLGYEDIPPAMNVLESIKHLFKANDLNIGGTAFDDDRLKHLYMSYSNPNDYIQEWNYGDLGKIKIIGNWYNGYFSNDNLYNVETHISFDDMGDGRKYNNVNLFQCKNTNISNIEDAGSNVIHNTYKDKYGDYMTDLSVIIPKDGYYKITLYSNINVLYDPKAKGWKDTRTGIRYTTAHQNDAHGNRNNTFDRSSYEIQLLRDFGDGDFNAGTIVGLYRNPNFPFENNNNNTYPRYYPKPQGALVIDPKTNQHFINGLKFGTDDWHKNPKDDGTYCNYMFIKNGWSWDKTFTQKEKILSAYDSSNRSDYNYWGWTQNEDDEVIGDGGEDLPKPVWMQVKQRYAKLSGTPSSFVRTYKYGNTNNRNSGEGEVASVIYLHKGERLALHMVSTMGDYQRSGSGTKFDQYVTIIDKLDFDLRIEPFRTDIGWNNFDINGNWDETKPISWDDNNNFQKGYIDLCKFLPSEIKINDFLDNFCKAFNLNLSQPTKGNFSLDVKQTKSLGTSDIVSFEDKFNVKLKSNEPLGLPSEINIKWNINEDEEGYVASNGYTGNGQFITGTIGGSVSEQSSIFSYNWYKPIRFMNNNIINEIPIISKHEVFEETTSADYAEMQKKWYTDLPIRFFYPDNLIGKENNYNNRIFDLGSNSVELMRVKNEYDKTNVSILDYENKEYSILNNYFTIITTNDTNYTIIETYLTPEEYELLDGRNLVKLNSDLYYVSAVEQYDPLMKSPCKIKLIRKI